MLLYTKTNSPYSSLQVVGEGSRAVGEKLLRIGFGVLKSLALPPSSSRGTLAVSGIYPACAKMICAGLRGGGTNNTSPRVRNVGSFKVRAEGVLGLLVNSTLDCEGRKNVFADWPLFTKVLTDLITVGKELGAKLQKWLLMLVRNVCLDKKKSYVLESPRVLAFVLDNCVGERAVRGYALQALWILLYKSEKAVAAVKRSENISKVLGAEALIVEEQRKGGLIREDGLDDDFLIAKSMDAVTRLMGGV